MKTFLIKTTYWILPPLLLLSQLIIYVLCYFAIWGIEMMVYKVEMWFGMSETPIFLKGEFGPHAMMTITSYAFKISPFLMAFSAVYMLVINIMRKYRKQLNRIFSVLALMLVIVLSGGFYTYSRSVGFTIVIVLLLTSYLGALIFLSNERRKFLDKDNRRA
jgi:hypothetical protein